MSGAPGTVAAEVVIVGGGFGGLAAAKALDRSGAHVTLVDRHVYSTFQPLLYQVATGALNPGDIAYPIRALSRKGGIRFRHGEVRSVDPAGRRVLLADGSALG